MTRLEEITPGTAIKGILPDSLVTAVNIQWFGSEALELTYKDAAGRVGNQLLYIVAAFYLVCEVPQGIDVYSLREVELLNSQ
jgi:hypothetical protein